MGYQRQTKEKSTKLNSLLYVGVCGKGLGVGKPHRLVDSFYNMGKAWRCLLSLSRKLASFKDVAESHDFFSGCTGSFFFFEIHWSSFPILQTWEF